MIWNFSPFYEYGEETQLENAGTPLMVGLCETRLKLKRTESYAFHRWRQPFDRYSNFEMILRTYHE